MLDDGHQVLRLEHVAHSPWMTVAVRRVSDRRSSASGGLMKHSRISRKGCVCAEFSIRGYQELVFLG